MYKEQIIVVSGVLYDQQGQILLGRRSYGEYQDCWETPGGKVDSGESPEDALAREWIEELGLKIKIGELLYVHSACITKSGKVFSGLIYEVSTETPFTIGELKCDSHDKFDWWATSPAKLTPLNQLAQKALWP